MCLSTAVTLWIIAATIDTSQATLGQRGVPERVPLYENVEILVGTPPEQFDRIMEAISVSLGVECEYCHVSGDPASDVKAAKETARQMMRMAADAGTSYFEALEAPSCWTCHRGSPVPEAEPVSEAPGTTPRAIQSAFSNEDRLSGEVYGNIRQYEDLPANALLGVMEFYSRALGVTCDHCHVEGEWASDARLMKLMSRRMLEIGEALQREYFTTPGAVSCWTCHRGETLPQTNLPPGLLPG
jgi:hypothetical protein